jgi:peptide chain release factor 2
MKISPFIAAHIKRKRKDFRIDTFRAGGKGGSNQNKRNSGCRITDLITGLSAEGRDERDFDQNKKNAFNRLCDKLLTFYKNKEIEFHKSQINDSANPLTIRTYKLDKGIVIDHRTGKTYAAKGIMAGDLDQLHIDILETMKTKKPLE